METGARDRAQVIALPPFIYGGALAIGLLLHFVFPVPFVPITLARWLGLLLILIAIPIVVSALRALALAKTPFDARKPTTAIVTGGAFRYSRNPMYISATLLYLGIASLINSFWILILVVPLMLVMQRGVVEREEKYLEHKFGDEYRHYKARVRRWI